MKKLSERQPDCWKCRGDGFYYVVPAGFNPFYAGAFATARVAVRRECSECRALLDTQAEEKR